MVHNEFFIRIVIIFIIVIIIVSSCRSVYGETFDYRFNILWIWDSPFPIGNPEFSELKSILSEFSASIIVKSAWEIWLLRDIGWRDWLVGGGYDLVVVVWSRSGYVETVKDFVDECISLGVPVLFVPSLGWNITGDYGLVMRDTLLFDVNFSVVDHVVSRGVWVVGVGGDIGVVSLYYRVNASSSYNVSWTPIALAPDGGAAVVVGTVNGTRVAAIAPYLYAYPGLDNERLFRNIILWLLGMDDEIIREYSESGDWGSVAAKDLLELRENLSMEIQSLYMERNRTLNELNELNNTLYTLMEEYNVTGLVELKDKLEAELRDLESRVNTTYSELEELKSQVDSLHMEKQKLEEILDNYMGVLRYGYRALGVGLAIGIVIGYVVARLVIMRQKHGSRKE